MAKEYIASFSGGKDSMATILLCFMQKLPLDRVVYCRVLYDNELSAEFPEHEQFLEKHAFPYIRAMGYKLDIVVPEKTYLDIFFETRQRGKYAGLGLSNGFPMAGRCYVQERCKLRSLRKYFKQHPDCVQYVGFTADETERLARLGNNQRSLLAEHNITQFEAKMLCHQHNMLSPIYNWTSRNGCWFCPSMGKSQLHRLFFSYPELADKLCDLEDNQNLCGKMWNGLRKQSIRGLRCKYNMQD